jgi:ATP-dependent Clp protease adapter protein ClpS
LRSFTICIFHKILLVTKSRAMRLMVHAARTEEI